MYLGDSDGHMNCIYPILDDVRNSPLTRKLGRTALYVNVNFYPCMYLELGSLHIHNNILNNCKPIDGRFFDRMIMRQDTESAQSTCTVYDIC